jgi:hypothetical protein
MSDPTQNNNTPSDTSNSKESSFLGIPAGTLITSAVSLISGVLGAGPWGIVGMALLAIGSIFGINKLVGYINGKIDARDNERAGADAGQTSVDLTNQVSNNAQAIKNEETMNPPTKGFKS